MLGNILAKHVIVGDHNANLGGEYDDVHIVVEPNVNDNVEEPPNVAMDLQAVAIPHVVTPPNAPKIVIAKDTTSISTISANEGNYNFYVVTVLADFSDRISALQGLIGNLVSNAQDIIPMLGGSRIIGTKCNIVDVQGTQGTSKRCYL